MEFSTGASIIWTHPVFDGAPCDEQPEKKRPIPKKKSRTAKFTQTAEEKKITLK